jgi:photosystem II stability/assembly factor-like uncharacterized protein
MATSKSNQHADSDHGLQWRRSFLLGVGSAALLGSLNPPLASAAEHTNPPEDPGWKPHVYRQGDGRGGWVCRSAKYQFLRKAGGRYLMAFGLANMDNGEILFAGSWHDGSAERADEAERPVISFSRDGGETWTEPQVVEGAKGRPTMLTWLGKGELMFQTDLERVSTQLFSHDYGRTWEKQSLQLSSNGENFGAEGNSLVDFDRNGRAVRIAQVGYNFPKGSNLPFDPTNGLLRWSEDGGRHWINETGPDAWRWKEEFGGKVYERGISEGALVRARNAWLVAALRTDMQPRYFDAANDNLEGTGVSLSKDDGKTWSKIKMLYSAGRMHATLLRLPNGTIVLTHVTRREVEDGRLVGFGHGCGAVLSHDNGATWDLSRRIVLDDFTFSDGTLNSTVCGHQFSTTLNDGSILTCYSHYLSKAAALIRWKPDA